MTNTELQMLEEAGFQVTPTLERFGNSEAMYKRFLTMFAQDQNFEVLKNACNERDAEKMFKSAHTIKGMSANLGLQNVHQITSKMVELYRAGMIEDAYSLLSSLTAAYQETIDTIKKYLNE